MYLSEALYDYLKTTGTSIGTRFYEERLPQLKEGEIATKLPAVYFSWSEEPVHSHGGGVRGLVRAYRIYLTVVTRDLDGTSGQSLGMTAARELVAAMGFLDGYRTGSGYSINITGTLLTELSSPDWFEMQRTWETDLEFTCFAS